MNFEIIEDPFENTTKLHVLTILYSRQLYKRKIQFVGIKANYKKLDNIYIDERIMQYNLVNKIEEKLNLMVKHSIKLSVLNICRPIYYIIYRNNSIEYVQILLNITNNVVPKVIKLLDFIDIAIINFVNLNSISEIKNLENIELNDNVKLYIDSNDIRGILVKNIENIKDITSLIVPRNISTSYPKVITKEILEFEHLKSKKLPLHLFYKAKKIKLYEECKLNTIEIRGINNLEELVIECWVKKINIRIPFEERDKSLKIYMDQPYIIINDEIYDVDKQFNILGEGIVIYKLEQ